MFLVNISKTPQAVRPCQESLFLAYIPLAPHWVCQERHSCHLDQEGGVPNPSCLNRSLRITSLVDDCTPLLYVCPKQPTRRTTIPAWHDRSDGRSTALLHQEKGRVSEYLILLWMEEDVVSRTKSISASQLHPGMRPLIEYILPLKTNTHLHVPFWPRVIIVLPF